MASEINTSNLSANINQLGSHKSTKASAKQNAPESGQTTGPVNAPAKETVSVTVTDQASKLQAIEEQLAAIPIVDSQKVEAVKQAIADGSFEIDPQRVAEKLLSFESGE